MRKACLTCHALGGRAGTLGGQDPHAVLPFGDEEDGGLLLL